MIAYLVILLAGVWAGAQNALAGGGSFITLPTLMLTGVEARTANVSSTIALFPGQSTTGFLGRKGVAGVGGLSFRTLAIVSLIGGAFGAVLLLMTPSAFFARLVPWLVLFATLVFAWGSFFRKPRVDDAPHIGPLAAGAVQFCIAVYGGYFGGGAGFMMMAALTLAGLKARPAAANKNVLAAVMNASAVLVFCFSGVASWPRVIALAIGAIIGGVIGSWALKRVNERALRLVVVAIGAALTVGLFLRGS